MKPTDFLSERMVFGLLIIIGFFGVGIVATMGPLAAEARQTAKDVLLVVGPLLGVIVNAIWRTDKAERQAADTAAVLAAKAPDLSAAAPAAVIVPGAAPAPDPFKIAP